MRLIDEEKIWKYLGYLQFPGEVRRDGPNAWSLLTTYGRRVMIYDTHVDFRGLTKRIPGETEAQRERLLFALMTVAEFSLDVVSLTSCWDDKQGDERGNLWIYAKCNKFQTECFCPPFSLAQAQKRFGEEASMTFRLGGWRVNLPDGIFVKFSFNKRRERTIEHVAGSNEVYRAAIRTLNDVQGFAVVRGSKGQILVGLAQGAAIGVRVIPELYPGWNTIWPVGFACGAAGDVIGLGIGVCTDNMGMGIWLALIISVVLMLIWESILTRGGIEGARRRGQALSRFTVGPDLRGTSQERDLRERGMF